MNDDYLIKLKCVYDRLDDWIAWFTFHNYPCRCQYTLDIVYSSNDITYWVSWKCSLQEIHICSRRNNYILHGETRLWYTRKMAMKAWDKIARHRWSGIKGFRFWEASKLGADWHTFWDRVRWPKKKDTSCMLLLWFMPCRPSVKELFLVRLILLSFLQLTLSLRNFLDQSLKDFTTTLQVDSLNSSLKSTKLYTTVAGKKTILEYISQAIIFTKLLVASSKIYAVSCCMNERGKTVGPQTCCIM